MGTSLMLMCLLFFCGFSFTQGCNQALWEDCDFPGADIGLVFSPDVEHCQHMCTQHSSCLFFSFIRPDSTSDNRFFHCFLKSTDSGKPPNQVSKTGLTSGYSLKTCNPTPNPHLYKLYQDVNFPGADYKILFTPDAEECQRACTHDPGCQFFTFLDEHYQHPQYRFKCHLKFSWTIPRTPHIRALADRISGFSETLQSPLYQPGKECETRLFPNLDIPGHDFETQPAASPEQCLALCSAHPQCTFFSYVSQQFKCYLKDNIHEMAPRVDTHGTTSGVPPRFCQLNNSWIRRVYVGLDFPYDDIRSFPLESAEACQMSCNQEPSCQFYSYVTSQRRCYLKRVITMPAPPRVNKMAGAISGFTLLTYT